MWPEPFESIARAVAEYIRQVRGRMASNAVIDYDGVARETIMTAIETGIPIQWLLATMYKESRFNPNADNGTAYGIGQFLPSSTAAYRDSAWTGPERTNWTGPAMTPAEIKSDWRQSIRMLGRFMQRLYWLYTVGGRDTRGLSPYQAALGFYGRGGGDWNMTYIADHERVMRDIDSRLRAMLRTS